MNKTFKKVKDYLQSSIKYLTSPSEWIKSYELSKEYFPHLKTLLEGIDDEVEVIEKEENPFNNKHMNRRDFFLLFSPIKV